jgi:uncharacterized protein YndB with AHSA1/START domain
MSPNEPEIRVERIFDALRTHVFSVWTDPQLIPEGWGDVPPGRTSIPSTIVPQRPGADWRQSGGLRRRAERSAAEPKRKESDGSSGLARDYVA